jgi:hypothetical protein
MLVVARPPQRLLSSGKQPLEFPDPVFPSSAPRPAPLRTGAAEGEALVSSGRPSTAGPWWTEPGVVHGPVDRVYENFLYKTILEIHYFRNLGNFVEKPLGFFLKSTCSP